MQLVRGIGERGLRLEHRGLRRPQIGRLGARLNVVELGHGRFVGRLRRRQVFRCGGLGQLLQLELRREQLAPGGFQLDLCRVVDEVSQRLVRADLVANVDQDVFDLARAREHELGLLGSHHASRRADGRGHVATLDGHDLAERRRRRRGKDSLIGEDASGRQGQNRQQRQ